MSFIESFKVKPFDLEPIYASWTKGPKFSGNPKKDPPVDEWLDQIKAGCIERNIPEEYWYKVAQHFMGPKAKARLDELKSVIAKVHGGKYRWTWKKFKVAMRNMGWGIDTAATEAIKVQGKGLWWKKKEDKEPIPEASASRPVPTRSASSFWRGSSKDEDAEALVSQSPPRPAPSRSGSEVFWPVRRNSKDDSKDDKAVVHHRPEPAKSKSDSVVPVMTARGTPKPPTPSRSNTGETITAVTQAPVWLLNACSALDYITSEHPKAMSVLSAILITAGSLPALPAISAGAGGAILASGAAHAIGAIAVGLGQVLSTQVKNQHEVSTQASSTVR